MRRPVPALIPFLVFISVVFIGILIFAYVETKKANPQMIEVGQVGNLRPSGTRPLDACARPSLQSGAAGRATLAWTDCQSVRRLPTCPTTA
jgi:hypothetical protein